LSDRIINRGHRRRERRVFFSCVPLWALWSAAAQGPSPNCTQLLQAQDAKAVAACKAQVDEAESGPASERMARIVADDEYGVALLAIAHQPKQALDSFNSGIALLPASTVKPDSLQWAVAFWHRATAYQQLSQWERAAGDLEMAEDTLTKGIAAAMGNLGKTLNTSFQLALGDNFYFDGVQSVTDPRFQVRFIFFIEKYHLFFKISSLAYI